MNIWCFRQIYEKKFIAVTYEWNRELFITQLPTRKIICFLMYVRTYSFIHSSIHLVLVAQVVIDCFLNAKSQSTHKVIMNFVVSGHGD
jgi:hypothetical protein